MNVLFKILILFILVVIFCLILFIFIVSPSTNLISGGLIGLTGMTGTALLTDIVSFQLDPGKEGNQKGISVTNDEPELISIENFQDPGTLFRIIHQGQGILLQSIYNSRYLINESGCLETSSDPKLEGRFSLIFETPKKVKIISNLDNTILTVINCGKSDKLAFEPFGSESESEIRWIIHSTVIT